MRRSLTALAVTLWASSLFAAPINPNNTRPVGVGAPPGLEASLQTILNGLFGMGAVNAATGQDTAGAWKFSNTPASSIPTLVAEYAGNAGTNKFGIWFGNDSTSLYKVDLFLGPASGGATAAMSLVGNTLHVGSSIIANCGTSINCGSFTNALVNPNFYGFYIDVFGTQYSTVDALNGGTARAVAYQHGATTNWALAFEDGGDFDYNDMVVKIESIDAAVPEPATMGLLGAGLLGLAYLARRRRA